VFDRRTDIVGADRWPAALRDVDTPLFSLEAKHLRLYHRNSGDSRIFVFKTRNSVVFVDSLSARQA